MFVNKPTGALCWIKKLGKEPKGNVEMSPRLLRGKVCQDG